MAKPTTKIAWTPTGAAVVDPGGAKKAAGWAPEEKPPAEWFNWLFLHISNWIDYLDVLAGQAFTWTAAHVFSAGISATATGAPAITGTAVTTGDGVHGVGAGPNAGVAGYGGATSGPGGYFAGGGSGPGVAGVGVGGNANGVEGTGHNAGNGVLGYGGSSNGAGVTGVGGGNGPGVVANGAGTAPGLLVYKGAGSTDAIVVDGNINANGRTVSNLVAPVAGTDAATRTYVDDGAPVLRAVVNGVAGTIVGQRGIVGASYVSGANTGSITLGIPGLRRTAGVTVTVSFAGSFTAPFVELPGIGGVPNDQIRIQFARWTGAAWLVDATASCEFTLIVQWLS